MANARLDPDGDLLQDIATAISIAYDHVRLARRAPFANVPGSALGQNLQQAEADLVRAMQDVRGLRDAAAPVPTARPSLSVRRRGTGPITHIGAGWSSGVAMEGEMR